MVYLISLGYDIKDIERAGLNLKMKEAGILTGFAAEYVPGFIATLARQWLLAEDFTAIDMAKKRNSLKTPISANRTLRLS